MLEFPGGRSAVVGVAEEGRGSKLRPFFTSPDEIYEEYYEVLPPEKKRRLTSEQVKSDLFQENKVSVLVQITPMTRWIRKTYGWINVLLTRIACDQASCRVEVDNKHIWDEIIVCVTK